MRFVDVNVLLSAHRAESEHHDDYRRWLDETRSGSEPMALSATVLAGFVRIVTHPRIYVDPTPLPLALDFATNLRASPATVAVEPGPRHWAIFERLCRDHDARGNLVPDAHLAAMALEHGASFWSADRGLRRFPELDLRHPLDG